MRARALDATARTAGALRFCPTCNAEPMRPCVSATGVEMHIYHQLRLPQWAQAQYRTRSRRRRS